MKVLVTGVNGQLGHDVCNHLDVLHIDNKGVDIADFDLTYKEQTLSTVITYNPDVVVHCAAYTAVDKAESEPELCRKVNVDGTRNVAEAVRQLNAKMVYISTDYVFSGEGKDPFEVDSPIDPQNVYGQTKANGETEVRKLTDKHFIIRISWAFGVNGKNFVKTMLRLAQEKTDLDVVCDQIGSPTYTDDLAALICDMILTEKYGTYHATNEGYCSWAEFAQEIMRLSGGKMMIHPIPTSKYPSAAKRPLNSRLSKKSLDNAGFYRLPTWKDALQKYLNTDSINKSRNK